MVVIIHYFSRRFPSVLGLHLLFMASDSKTNKQSNLCLTIIARIFISNSSPPSLYSQLVPGHCLSFNLIDIWWFPECSWAPCWGSPQTHLNFELNIYWYVLLRGDARDVAVAQCSPQFSLFCIHVSHCQSSNYPKWLLPLGREGIGNHFNINGKSKEFKKVAFLTPMI